jgi:hypothetical protein
MATPVYQGSNRNIGNAQFGNVEEGRPEFGVSWASPDAPEVASAGAFNYGLKNRLTMWRAKQSSGIGKANIGTNVDFEDSPNYKYNPEVK